MQSQAQFPGIPGTHLQAQFDAFLNAHPRVWSLFVAFTQSAIAKGHRHLSADLVLHRIRWESSVVTGEKPYKLNNNLTPYFARRFHAEFPSHDGFFRMRKVKGES
jgi:hypothetical protein